MSEKGHDNTHEPYRGDDVDAGGCGSDRPNDFEDEREHRLPRDFYAYEDYCDRRDYREGK